MGVEVSSCVYSDNGLTTVLNPVYGSKSEVEYSLELPASAKVFCAHGGNHQTRGGIVGMSSMDVMDGNNLNEVFPGARTAAMNTGDNGGFAIYDPSSGKIMVVDATGQSVDAYNKYCDGPVGNAVDENGNVVWENTKSINGWENTQNILNGQEGNKHWLACLKNAMKLCETLEDCAEQGKIADDKARTRRHEYKAKEMAVQQQKDAETERLRQQQLAEQRKKKDSQKKDSDKKQDVKKETKKEKPKKDTPTPAPATADIDFSKLNSLISQQASFLRGIISSGQKATSAQHAKFNSLNNQYASEFNRLKAQIGNISDPAKRSQYYSKLASINSRMNSEVDPLLAQGASRGLFTNL